MPSNPSVVDFKTWAREAPYNAVFNYYEEPVDPAKPEVPDALLDACLSNTKRAEVAEAQVNAILHEHHKFLSRDRRRHEAQFEYARKLSDAGLVFLFRQRLDDGRWRWCARRSPIRAHHVLDKVSRSVHVEPSRAALGIRGRRPELHEEEA